MTCEYSPMYSGTPLVVTNLGKALVALDYR